MISDYERFKQLLDSVECEYSESTGQNETKVLLFKEGSRKVTGYSGFFVEITFSKDGKFIEIGAFE